MKLKIQSLALLLILVACDGKKNETDGSDTSETAQQVGDIMASIDEAGGGGSTIGSMQKSVRKTFARYAPNELDENKIAQLFLPQAQAVTCSDALGNASGFGACSNLAKVRNFSGCTVGSAIFSGNVTLTWAGTGVTGCNFAQMGNTITRVPAFTVEGRRGAILSVSKSGTIGQRLTWTGANTYTFTNDGIERKFTSAGTTLFDHITTATAMTVAGANRLNRTINGGNLRVTNNVTGAYCDFIPNNVQWQSGTCNCPSAGTWSATCVDANNNTSSATLNLTGCGTATYTEGTQTSNVAFDRCG